MNPPHAPRAVLETALYATDLDAVAAFYTGVIGLQEHLRVPGRYVFMRLDSSMLLLFNPEATRESGGKLPVPPHGATGEGHICFRVAPGELDAWASHLATGGVEIEADFEWPSGARSIYVRDPSQNSVEFAEARLWDFEA